ncbi:hypothetical protein H072_10455 [Dactylellina haptotyla CBS 200.50]|uniref:Postreplication repair E3 ubiquitin-protein ligase RAD18 n=1 Tax=Dactylellina haptotyla (strain CBS 200.50) TaxID=1284197 RepID=S8A4I9_DACHA|nr:hypothetical protein H072_10455 [Dactylellina haptotyla CBS 200.50]
MDVNFPDPTDWLSTSVPGIQALETALSCQVCKEFFTAPVATSCGHTFCSLCIRRCLSATQKCPTCMTTDDESRLRKNTLVQDILSSFTAIRKQMLDGLVIKEEPEPPITKEPEAEKKRVEKRSSYDFDEEIEEEETTNNKRRGKRRKQEEAPVSSGGSSDRPRRSTRTSSQRTNSKISSQTAIVIDDSDEDFNPNEINSDNEFESGSRPKRGRPSRVPETPPTTNLVPCPICGRLKEPEQIQSHANRCIEGKRSPSPSQNAANAASSSLSPLKRPPISFSNIPKPAATQFRAPYTEEEKQKLKLAKGNFTLTKEADIRKRLRENGIRVDVKGKESKNAIWARLQEWTNLWNANLDSEMPKTKQALVKELETSERHQQSQKPSVVQDKEFAREEWGKDHRTEYENMIADAKMRVLKKKNEAESATNGDKTDTASEPPRMTAEVNGIGSPEIIET